MWNYEYTLRWAQQAIEWSSTQARLVLIRRAEFLRRKDNPPEPSKTTVSKSRPNRFNFWK